MSPINNTERPLELDRDFSKGDRSYLKEQGISEKDFNRLDPVSRKEWKEECHLGSYETMRNYGKKVTKIFV